MNADWARRAMRPLVATRLARRGSCAAVAVVVSVSYVRLGPLPDGLLDLRSAESIEISDRNGEVLYEARAGDGSRASWLAADRLPQALIDATVAAEDRRFFSHPGIDPIAIARAAARNLKNRRWLEGGSTITQQAAKLLLARREPGSRRSFAAKVHEAIVALRLEHRFSKREVLALYLNLAPYGNQLSGASRASRVYFGQDATLLTVAQAAFLASLPQRPSTYNPYRDPQRARRRQERVIVQMGLSRKLDAAGVRTALDERLAFAPDQPAFVAPHFVERALAQARLSACAAPRAVASPAMEALPFGAAPAAERCTITTTLDASLQRMVAGIVRAARPSLERHGAHNVAAVVLDNATGEWLAWEGSGNYDDAEHGGKIDGVVSPRQPGSALKPFTYALAFESGLSPATVLPDVPSFFATAKEGVVYEPRNYDGRFRGPLPARRALAGSQNVPAVALASQVGVADLLRFLRAAGLSTFDRNAAYYGVGLTLGDAEVRLDQLVAAYSAFARGGDVIEPIFVCGPGGCGQPRQGRPLMSERTAFWISDILSDDDARAYSFGRGGSLEFPFRVAVKTGTSQAYHDNWAIGYTRDVTVGVWVGNFDRRPLEGSSGVTGAGPIFHAIMLAAVDRAHGGLPDPGIPATRANPQYTKRQTICALSGLAATRDCPTQIDEWVGEETASQPCSWHRAATLAGGRAAINWPLEYQAWASTARLLDVDREPREPREPHESRRLLRVVSPPDGAVYLIDPTLRREFQTIGLRGSAVARTLLEWKVDGEPIGRADSDASLDWPLTPGRHVVSVQDSSGMSARVEIVVR